MKKIFGFIAVIALIISCNKNDFPSDYNFPYEIEKIYKPVGCNDCYHTGFRGRTAIYEVINVTPKIASAIKNNNFNTYFESDEDYKSLSDKAFDVLAKGETSLDEIYSILLNI